MQVEDNDFLIRQIKNFAAGLGYVLAKDQNSTTEIVFPETDEQITK